MANIIVADSLADVGLTEDDVFMEEDNIVSFDPLKRDWVSKPMARIVEEKKAVGYQDNNFMMVECKVEVLPVFRKRNSMDALDL